MLLFIGMYSKMIFLVCVHIFMLIYVSNQYYFHEISITMSRKMKIRILLFLLLFLAFCSYSMYIGYQSLNPKITNFFIKGTLYFALFIYFFNFCITLNSIKNVFKADSRK